MQLETKEGKGEKSSSLWKGVPTPSSHASINGGNSRFAPSQQLELNPKGQRLILLELN